MSEEECHGTCEFCFECGNCIDCGECTCGDELDTTFEDDWDD